MSHRAEALTLPSARVGPDFSGGVRNSPVHNCRRPGVSCSCPPASSGDFHVLGRVLAPGRPHDLPSATARPAPQQSPDIRLIRGDFAKTFKRPQQHGRADVLRVGTESCGQPRDRAAQPGEQHPQRHEAPYAVQLPTAGGLLSEVNQASPTHPGVRDPRRDSRRSAGLQPGRRREVKRRRHRWRVRRRCCASAERGPGRRTPLTRLLWTRRGGEFSYEQSLISVFRKLGNRGPRSGGTSRVSAMRSYQPASQIEGVVHSRIPCGWPGTSCRGPRCCVGETHSPPGRRDRSPAFSYASSGTRGVRARRALPTQGVLSGRRPRADRAWWR